MHKLRADDRLLLGKAFANGDAHNLRFNVVAFDVQARDALSAGAGDGEPAVGIGGRSFRPAGDVDARNAFVQLPHCGLDVLARLLQHGGQIAIGGGSQALHADAGALDWPALEIAHAPVQRQVLHESQVDFALIA